MKNELIRTHAKILLGGLLHGLKGTLATATLALGCFIFYCVTQERGYLAVGLFVAASLTVTAGLLQFYFCGRDMMGGKFSK